MGYGMDEEWEEEPKEETEHQKMLAYHGMSEYEWQNTSNNEKANLRWNYRKFGRY